MENFNYYTPTKVVFGRGTEEQVGELVRQQECKKYWCTMEAEV